MENWAPSALRLNGENQLLVLAYDQLQGETPINLGTICHVLGEKNAEASQLTLYVNGRVGDQLSLEDAELKSLQNHAYYKVGEGFAGTLEYLRIARSSLTESSTTLNELMA